MPYVEYSVDSNTRDAKFKINDHVKISKYKNIFAKGYAPNQSEEIFVISKVKNTMPQTYVILMILMVKKLLERFTKKNRKKQVKQSLELKK